ncbi:uncharacterized protein PAF06_001232 [Gastrophryne carolinensis]
MKEKQSHMTEKILNLSLEIIYLLTGEDCVVVKKSSGECVGPETSGGWSRMHDSGRSGQKKRNNYKILKLANKIIGLLSGEEWECIDEEVDDVVEEHQPLILADGSSKKLFRRTGRGSPDSQDDVEDDDEDQDNMDCIDLTLRNKGGQGKSHAPEERNEMTEQLLDLTLEIIYLLTGEECLIIYKSSGELVTSRSHAHLSGDWTRDPFPSPLPLIHKNNREQKILEVTHKIIELLTGEDDDSDDDYKEEVVQDGQTVVTSDAESSDMSSAEGSPSPHYSRNAAEDHHVTRVYQDEHGGDFKIYVKQEKKDNQAADDDVIHVTIKEEDYPADINVIDGRRIRRTSEGCLILTCDDDDDDDDEDDVIQDSPEEGPITIDVHPPRHCTEKALDLSNPVAPAPEVAPQSVGAVVLNPGFDGFFIKKGAKKSQPPPKPQATAPPPPPPKSNRGRKKIPYDEKRFQCCECGKFFPHKSYLIKHERSHTGEKPFACSECGKCFTDNSGLMKHVRIHLTERPYQCCACGKGFTYKADLIKHERIHTGEKPFPCSKCGKCFTDKSGRAKHERIHSGEKPFPCPICGKCFSRKSHMAKHQIIHTGEKPFSCEECGRCFGRKSHLTNHQILHRGEKPYVCPECGKCFAQRPGLIIHRKIHKPKVPPPPPPVPSTPPPVSLEPETRDSGTK